jgi:thiol-disulfide isomerase/thioredoxin
MMKRSLLLITPLLLLLTGCSTGGVSHGNESAFIAGNGSAVVIPTAKRNPAPHFVSATLGGGNYVFQPGKLTVLNIWASWCSPCRAEAPVLSDFSKKNPEIVFLGLLTRDNLSAAQSFIKRFALEYPILTDDSIVAGFKGSITPNAIPTTLVIDAAGRVAARISGEVSVAVLQDVLQRVSGGAVHA